MTMAAWLVAGALALAGDPARAPAPSPAAIGRELRTLGPRRTVLLLAEKRQWDATVDAMDGGDPAWIALAPALARGADGGAAEELGIALAFALPRNPRAVLAALDRRNGPVLGVERVCGRPFVEDTEPERYRATALAALARVRDPRLAATRRACLRALR